MSRPSLTTGHEPSATEFNDLFTQFGVNTSGDQSVTNSTTLVDATGLSVNLRTSRWYRYHGVLFYNVPAANDFKFALGGTATIGYIVHSAHSVPSGGTAGQWYSLANFTSGTAWVAEGQGGPASIEMRGTIQCTGSGTLTVQFAESVAGAATSAIMLKGSYIAVEVIA